MGTVKDQGSCGSCWAFSATGAIEGNWAIANNVNLDLSEQEMVDCCRLNSAVGCPESEGCDGGWMSEAIEWNLRNHGQAFTSDYPYHAKDESCHSHMDEEAPVVTHLDFAPGDLESLVHAANDGPVAVGVNANIRWMLYSGGVVMAENCGGTVDEINHGVVVVGWTPDEWIIRNSWGARWGESGHIRLQRSATNYADNACGVVEVNSFPLFE